MNLLLISYVFPPAGGVGVLRAASLAKYLPENDVRVDVLTARNAAAVGTESSLLKQIPGSVTIHSTWTLDLPFGLRKALKKIVSGGGKKTAQATKAAPGKPNALKQLVGNLLQPDPQVGWLPFAYPAAKRIIEERAIDVVLITAPPFSTLTLATKLRRLYPSLPIVIDFRDEWLTTTIELVLFNANDRARSLAKKIEAEAVHAATAVVAVTAAAQREIGGRYPAEDQAKFRLIQNGYDQPPPAGPRPPRARDGKTVLTYIGSVYGSTDPRTFVEAVRSLPESLRARLKVRFIGYVESDVYRDALTSLGDLVELKGFVPQAEALRAIEDTDYVLLITHDHINVSAKLYDYLGGGKPVLGMVKPDGDVRRILDETRAGWWADVADPKALARLLTDAIERRDDLGAQFVPDAARIADFHRRPLAKRYAELLRGLV